jgi:NAD(P)-dependent dehydrogenase (short-subunit alcohol dehydrogenase family)
MDLTNGAGVDELGRNLFDRHRRLDILVHAAAILGALRPVGHTPVAVWDKLVATNLTVAYRLIRSLEVLLRASDRGRAVFLTCAEATAPRAFWGPYAATKAGLETMARAWADEVEVSSLRVLLADPGPVRTGLRHQAFPGEDKERLTPPEAIGPWIVGLLRNHEDPGLPGPPVRFDGRRRAAGHGAPEAT